VAPELASHLLITRRVVNDADNWRQSGPLTPAVRQLYQLADRLRRSARGRCRRDMLRIAALYAEFFGWLREGERRPDLGRPVDRRGRWSRVRRRTIAISLPTAYVRMSQLAEVDV